jgi:hypothetical protein
MKNSFSKLVFSLSSFLLGNFCIPSQAWDGPPSSVGGGLMGLAKPSTYIDTIFLGSPNGQTPLNGRIRANTVLSESETDTYQMNFKSEVLQFTSSTPLGASGLNTPTNLWAIDVGGTYKHKIDQTHDWGLILSAGSPSDIPFNSLNEVDGSATATYSWRKDMLHAWIFMLNYSKVRSFAPGIPLPGVGYFEANPGNHTQVFYGLPFFFSWQPEKQLKLSATYFLLTYVNAQAEYKALGGINIYSGFQWSSQSWLRANRSDTNNRIIFDQKRLVVGASTSLSENLFANIFTGQAFDQRITEAASITSQNLNYNYLSAGVIGQAELAYKF